MAVEKAAAVQALSVQLVRLPASDPGREACMAAAALLAQQAHQPWYDYSGELVTGEDCARHLEMTLALLRDQGWDSGVWEPSELEEALEDLSDAETLGEMLAALGQLSIRLGVTALRDLPSAVFDLVRQSAHLGGTKARSLSLRDALRKVERTGRGGTVAVRTLEFLLCARSGASSANVHAWTERPGRTVDEVVALLETGAAFARTYGPGGDPSARSEVLLLATVDQARAVGLWTWCRWSGQEIADRLDEALRWLGDHGWPAHSVSAALKATNPDAGVIGAEDKAERVLDVIVEVRGREHSGSPRSLDAWERCAGRTFDEVRDLLQTGAEFARVHGPRGGA